MKTVLITGAASGLGWALARSYHARGWHLLLTDINADGLAERVRELGAERVISVAGDITDQTLQQHLLTSPAGAISVHSALPSATVASGCLSITLETGAPRNLALYQRHGFRLSARRQFPGLLQHYLENHEGATERAS